MMHISRNSGRYLVVISFYEARPVMPLDALVSKLLASPAGADFDLVVVVNRTSEGELVLSMGMGAAKEVVSRPNEGMNIGAWDHAWRTFPGYDGYLFLQDECELKSSPWLSPFVQAASDPSIGLVGESWNRGWDRPWDVMKMAVEGHAMPGHEIDGIAVNRVDLYLDCMRRHGVPPGPTAGHLRSLVWFARRDTLEAMGGFLCGRSYGECIAAEISASKRVEALKLRAIQVGEQPFVHFGHMEWRVGPQGHWIHGPTNAKSVAQPPTRWASILARLRAAVQ
jgi:hypothetical protein